MIKALIYWKFFIETYYCNFQSHEVWKKIVNLLIKKTFDLLFRSQPPVIYHMEFVEEPGSVASSADSDQIGHCESKQISAVVVSEKWD